MTGPSAHISWVPLVRKQARRFSQHFIVLNWVTLTLLAARKAGRPRSKDSFSSSLTGQHDSSAGLGHFFTSPKRVFVSKEKNKWVLSTARKRRKESGQVVVCVKHLDGVEMMRTTRMDFWGWVLKTYPICYGNQNGKTHSINTALCLSHSRVFFFYDLVFSARVSVWGCRSPGIGSYRLVELPRGGWELN